MPLNFTAIDFETANSSAASACSVGMVKVRDGKVVDRAGWFIRPPAGHDAFLEWNIKIHGIRPSDVAGAAGWAAQLPDLVAFADGDHLVAHNAGFDLGVISTSSTVAGLAIPDFAYVCSLQVARRTYHLDSYRLPVAAMAAGFEDFAHHDALADAEACAAIMIHAAQRHEADTLEELAHITRVKIGVIGPVATREHASTHGPMALN
ncbi:exonuclease domain-containing protein [Cryobacterium tagatosivorans]|uniref:DNA polymerase III subunit epsilon n=1 Tax=Cryobacterium tagatosivorans TaxID=1259199 RepID=A0A4R8UEN4_9MICO|nr:exonuclease domain-containing protein [Cryobacterium tagatosivorans]TFB50391.1 DNA polymerase III subunit epsilon [Cryobacterium tagatosivorans]